METTIMMGGIMERKSRVIFVKRGYGRYFKVIEDDAEKEMFWDDFYDFLKRFKILSVNKVGEGFEVEVA